MSNDNQVTKNPIYVNTPSGSAIINKGFAIQKIRWSGGSGAVLGDICEIKDGPGTRQIFYAEMPVAKGEVSEDFNPPLYVGGLRVTLLDSGKLYIYVAGDLPSS